MYVSIDVIVRRALYRYLVQRIERRAAAVAAGGCEHGARFGAQLRAGYAGEKVVYRIAVVFGQKAEPAAVDAGHGRRAVFEAVYAVEQRAVAAVADHEGALGLGADAFAEQLPLRETESRDPFRLGRELPIDRDLEPVGPCGVENPAHLVGRGRRVRTRKK